MIPKNKISVLKCALCGRSSEIKWGRVGIRENRKYVVEPICNLCREIGHEKVKPIKKVKRIVKKLNERTSEKEREFESAKNYWRNIREGIGLTPAVRVDKNGRLLCSVPNCKCHGYGQKPVGYFAVVGMQVIGLCRYQYAALKKSKVTKEEKIKIFASYDLSACREYLEKKKSRLMRPKIA
jgi:hypothetical protein